MPRIASAKKNMRKTRAATIRKQYSQRATLRTALKKAKSGTASPAEKKVTCSSWIAPPARAWWTKNAAARHKSQIARKA